MVKIFLDAGHGGTDSGAVGFGLKEKDVTLKIVKKIKTGLEQYKDVEIMMTRTTDKTVSLNDRTATANKWKADLFVSVHCNAANKTANGFETFIHNGLSNTSKERKIQIAVHNAIMTELGNVTNRGMKKDNFHVLRETKMSAILTENLFIDNAKDNAKLANDKYIQKIADGHVNGLVKYYGLKKKVNKTEDKSKEGDKKTVYRVISGTYKNKDNSLDMINKLKKNGFDGFAIKEDGYYKVICGSFSDKRYANNRKANLKDFKIDSYVQKYTGI